MAVASKLVAEKRNEFGSRACRRLRGAKRVPGNVYGHKQDAVAISVPEDVLRAAVFSGHRVVDLEIDGHGETAIFREVQWDTFGVAIKHFDLVRIDADERVTVEVPIVLKGTAPGVVAGGIVEQPLHTLTIECRALDLPDSIIVRIGELQMGQAIHVSDLKLAEGIEVQDDADAVVVQVVEPMADVEAAEGEPGPAEPEVIGKKKEDEEGEGEEK